MRCYEVDPDGNVTAGFALDESGEIPCVRIGPANPLSGHESATAIFSDSLSKLLKDSANKVFKATSQRLLRCDYDARSLFYLTPETDDTKNDALVLVRVSGKSPDVRILIGGVRDELLLQDTYPQLWKPDSGLVLQGKSALFHLKYLERATIRLIWKEAEQPTGWRKQMEMPKFIEKTRSLSLWHTSRSADDFSLRVHCSWY